MKPGSITECVVCFEEYHEPHATNCGHVFCKACIDGLPTKECPTCRTRIVNTFRIFLNTVETDEAPAAAPAGPPKLAAKSVKPLVNERPCDPELCAAVKNDARLARQLQEQANGEFALRLENAEIPTGEEERGGASAVDVRLISEEKCDGKNLNHELLILASELSFLFLKDGQLEMMKPYFPDELIDSWPDIMVELPSKRLTEILNRLNLLGELPSFLNALVFLKDEKPEYKQAYNYLLEAKIPELCLPKEKSSAAAIPSAPHAGGPIADPSAINNANALVHLNNLAGELSSWIEVQNGNTQFKAYLPSDVDWAEIESDYFLAEEALAKLLSTLFRKGKLNSFMKAIERMRWWRVVKMIEEHAAGPLFNQPDQKK